MTDWTQAGKGAIGGALAGGSIGGPWGALGGGVLGGLGGMFGDNGNDQTNQMLQDYYNRVMGRQTPQLGQASQGGYSGFRQNQSALISRLEGLSNGTGPSLAAQQFQQATDRNMSSQQAMMASGRGGPMASFNAANNMAMLGNQAAQGSTLARTNEELGATSQLGSVIAQGRGADENMNQFNAGQQNSFAIANLEARLRKMNMDDGTISSIIGQMQGNANKPGVGDQIMSGGAGMFAMGSMMGKGRGGQGGQNGAQGTPYYSGPPQDNGWRQQAQQYDQQNQPGGDNWMQNGGF